MLALPLILGGFVATDEAIELPTYIGPIGLYVLLAICTVIVIILITILIFNLIKKRRKHEKIG